MGDVEQEGGRARLSAQPPYWSLPGSHSSGPEAQTQDPRRDSFLPRPVWSAAETRLRSPRKGVGVQLPQPARLSSPHINPGPRADPSPLEPPDNRASSTPLPGPTCGPGDSISWSAALHRIPGGSSRCGGGVLWFSPETCPRSLGTVSRRRRDVPSAARGSHLSCN